MKVKVKEVIIKPEYDKQKEMGTQNDLEAAQLTRQSRKEEMETVSLNLTVFIATR